MIHVYMIIFGALLTTNYVTSFTPNLKNKIRELYHLAEKDPIKFIHIMNATDPFMIKSPTNFTCNHDEKFPVKYNTTSVEKFKNNDPNSYIFFQHMQKAGGSSFCELAKATLPKGSVPIHNCMPDDIGAYGTYPNDNLIAFLKQRAQYKVVANERNVFYSYFLNYPNAVFVANFRDPLDRWYSQYRFEHVEHRDGSTTILPFLTWYNISITKVHPPNYYVKTFHGEILHDEFRDQHENVVGVRPGAPDYYAYRWQFRSLTPKAVSWEYFMRAVENLTSFSLMYVLEWVKYDFSEKLLADMLGWTKKIPRAVPRSEEVPRDMRSIPILSALTMDEYMALAVDNVYDLLFYAILRRMVLERAYC